MVVVAAGLSQAGASSLTKSLVRDAHRSSTKSVYASHWRSWVKWCSVNGVSPLAPSGMVLANHLSDLAINHSMSASALRVRRSAILTTLRQSSPGVQVSLSVSSDVIKGTALRRASCKKRSPDWDLRLVLDFLVSPRFEPIELSDIQALTWKTSFLVMLAIGRRASEVHALSGLPSDVVRERDGSFTLRFLPEFLAKNQSPGSPSPSVRVVPLSVYADEVDVDFRLCPVRALRVYVSRTKERRGLGLRRLFLPCNTARRKDVIKSTFAKWLSTVIKDAYSWAASRVDIAHGAGNSPGGGTVLPLVAPRAHEVRAWSSSLAASQSARISDVLSSAYWRSPEVFISCYLRDLSARRMDGVFSLSTVVSAGHVVQF